MKILIDSAGKSKQDDLVFKRIRRNPPKDNIGDGIMGKGVTWSIIVNQQLSFFISRDDKSAYANMVNISSDFFSENPDTSATFTEFI